MALDAERQELQKSWLETWKEFSREIGGFQSRILLGIFYFFVVAPFGIIVRATGDPLSLRKAKGTNWTARNDSANPSLEAGRNQF
jgi:hypothetical protein